MLVPPRLPQADADTPPADAIIDEVPLDGIAIRSDAGAWQPLTVHRISVGEQPTLDEQPCVVLIDASDLVGCDALYQTLAALPASALVGFSDYGRLGATRAYRLLAACDEQAFGSAELAQAGSGVRHALVVALPEESDLLAAAAICGGLLIDGIGDALYLPRIERPRDLAFTILQAVKARTTRADYVACPSCGRTLFDLIEVTDHVRQATAHLEGVTIAIMGCIVNGPGEMADADFGFVGSGPGKVTLYRGKEAVMRNIPFDGARDQLIDLIKADGKWSEPRLRHEHRKRSARHWRLRFIAILTALSAELFDHCVIARDHLSA